MFVLYTKTQTVSCTEMTTAKFIRTTYKTHKAIVNINDNLTQDKIQNENDSKTQNTYHV